MNRRTYVLTLAATLFFVLQVHAQDRGYWRALSKTARATTGDISLSEFKVGINFLGFTIAQIRALEAKDTNAVFSDLDGAPATGNLYRLSIPGGKQFLHKQTLCGNDDTQWMVTAVEGKTLHLAFFSGSAMPALTPEGMANNTNLCGTYTYTR